MAVQSEFEWITWSRVRVLRELSEFRTAREIAVSLSMSYDGVRSIIRDIKVETQLSSVRDIGRWWSATAPHWLSWAAQQGGVTDETHRRYHEKDSEGGVTI